MSTAGTILDLILQWGFPVYALTRAVLRGLRSGIATRLPGKLLGLMAAQRFVMLVVDHANSISGEACYRAQYALTIYLPVFIGGLTIFVYLARFVALEDRIDRALDRNEWSKWLRRPDALLGAAIELLAAPMVLYLLYEYVPSPDPPLLTSAVQVVMQLDSYDGTLRPLVDLTGYPALWQGLLDLGSYMGPGEGIVPTTTILAMGNRCGTNYQGPWLLAIFPAIAILPITVALSFDSLLFSRRTLRAVATGKCGGCNGVGTYRLFSGILTGEGRIVRRLGHAVATFFETGAACRSCLGSGTYIAPSVVVLPRNPSLVRLGDAFVAGCGLYALLVVLQSVYPYLH